MVCQNYSFEPLQYSNLPRFDCIDKAELRPLFQAVLELRDHCDKLRRYARVNQEAIARIHAKLRNYSHAASQALGQETRLAVIRRQLEAQVLGCLQRLNSLNVSIPTLRTRNTRAFWPRDVFSAFLPMKYLSMQCTKP